MLGLANMSGTWDPCELALIYRNMHSITERCRPQESPTPMPHFSSFKTQNMSILANCTSWKPNDWRNVVTIKVAQIVVHAN